MKKSNTKSSSIEDAAQHSSGKVPGENSSEEVPVDDIENVQNQDRCVQIVCHKAGSSPSYFASNPCAVNLTGNISIIGNLSILPENIRDGIIMLLSGKSLHNLRQVNSYFNNFVLNVWKSKRGIRSFNATLQSNWRFPVQLRNTLDVPILFKFEISTDILVAPFEGFIAAVNEHQFVMRSWNGGNIPIKDSRVAVFDSNTNDFWEVPNVNKWIIGPVYQNDFEVVVTERILCIRIEFLGPVPYNLIRVWSLASKTCIFTATVPCVKIVCVRRVLKKNCSE